MSEKNPDAVALGRRGGLKGGVARAAKMTAEERRLAASRAARARWSASAEGKETPMSDRHELERNTRWLLRRATDVKVSLPWGLGKDGRAELLFEMVKRDPTLTRRWHKPSEPGKDWYLTVNFAGVEVWVGGWPRAEARLINQRVRDEQADREGPATPAPFAYAGWRPEQGLAS